MGSHKTTLEAHYIEDHLHDSPGFLNCANETQNTCKLSFVFLEFKVYSRNLTNTWIFVHVNETNRPLPCCNLWGRNAISTNQ